MQDEISAEVIDAFAEAFNRHDVLAIVGMMTEDGVFEATAGSRSNAVNRGKAEVARAVEDVFHTSPDARGCDAPQFVEGNRAGSVRVFSGLRRERTRVEVRGWDVFTLRDGMAAAKNCNRKWQA